MITRHILRPAIAAAFLTALSTPAAAIIVNGTFAGEVSLLRDLAGTENGPIADGTPISGTFSYDTTVPEDIINPGTYRGALTSFTLDIGVTASFSGSGGDVGVDTEAGFSQIVLDRIGGVIGPNDDLGNAPTSFVLELDSLTRTLANEDLPTAAALQGLFADLDVSANSGGRVRFGIGKDFTEIGFMISSATVQQVPAPASAGLMLCAIACLAILRRCRQKDDQADIRAA